MSIFQYNYILIHQFIKNKGILFRKALLLVRFVPTVLTATSTSEWQCEQVCFFFSPVHNPFQQHITDFCCSECIDTESKGDNHIKVVIAAVRQMQVAFCFVFFQNSAIVNSLYSCTDCWGDNPEQFHKFKFGHPYIGGISRQGDIALPVHCNDASSLFHWYSVL